MLLFRSVCATLALMQSPLTFPALHASHAGIWMATPDGQVRTVGKGEAVGRAAETPMVMLNAPLVAQRLGYADLSGLDVLELFAFVHPARFVVPTAKGLANVLGITPRHQPVTVTNSSVTLNSFQGLSPSTLETKTLKQVQGDSLFTRLAE